MTTRLDVDHIELYLIRVLKTLITERSVSRAAMRLQSTQPAVSAQLKRLRALTGDPLLVRAGNTMTPTETALRLVEPATRLLQEADRLFSPQARERSFDAASHAGIFRIAASDYLDPLFLPGLVAHIKRLTPQAQLELRPLTGEYDYRRSLAAGEVDLVIGNWLKPPGELHLGRLMSDEVVCLVAEAHPAASRSSAARGWTPERYLACEHVAPTPMRAGEPGASPRGSPGGSPGVIDEHLAAIGVTRNVMVRSAHFGLIPLMVAQSLLVLTTGRLFCSRYVDALPVRIVRCPVPFPALTYYQLWHDLTHVSASGKWLREQVREVARQLTSQSPPRRAETSRDDTTPTAPRVFTKATR